MITNIIYDDRHLKLAAISRNKNSLPGRDLGNTFSLKDVVLSLNPGGEGIGRASQPSEAYGHP